MDERVILVCIDQLERATFLPSPLWEELEAVDGAVHYLPSENLSQAEFLEILEKQQPDVLVTAWSTPRLPVEGEAHLKVLTHLKKITHLAGSLKAFPRSYLEQGVVVTNWGASISRTVAECALMLILCSLRETARFQLEMHVERLYERTDSFLSLFERRVGIYGFGRVGQALTRLLAVFGCSVTALDVDIPQAVFDELGVQRCGNLATLFMSSDIVVSVAPDTAQYYHSIHESHLRLLSADSVFVNVGRGNVIDENVLVKVAQEGWLRLGLDVFEEEPLPENSPLRGLKNVCMLPHIGGPTFDRRIDAGRRALSLLREWLECGYTSGAVTLEEYDRAT